jgi:tryptophan 7-halogenase
MTAALLGRHFANSREGSPFWHECRALDLPERLAHKLLLFRDSGRLVQYEWETFLQPSWLSFVRRLGSALVRS